MNGGVREVLEGTHAVSYAVQRSRVGVVAAYPITPSSGIVELLSEMCADRRLNARFVAVESEHSAMATCAGASQAGVRAFTATSSHGLAYMHEMLHWCAGARLPIVLANVNRAMGSPWNIFVDQNDSLSQRDTGWLQYYCENNQEVFDTIVQAYAVAERVLLPVMVCLDAFFLSHTSEPVSLPSQDAVDAWLPPFAPEHTLSPSSPRTFGGLPLSDTYMELRARMQRSMQDAIRITDAVAWSYAEHFGRLHLPVARVGPSNADVVLVTSGTLTGTARDVVASNQAAGRAIALAKLHLFRPFPTDALREAVGRARKVAVIDRNISFGLGGIMASEIRAALYGLPNAPTLYSFVAGLGGRDVTPECIDDVLRYTMEHDQPSAQTLWVGLKESEPAARPIEALSRARDRGAS
ncbi:MAG: pyruvate ferredoxin oxidoreductase [Vicinamibacterales bacterium]